MVKKGLKRLNDQQCQGGVELMLLQDSLRQVERGARERDLQIAEQQDSLEKGLKIVDEIEKQADELGYMLIKKSGKNHSIFTQNISDNIEIIVRENYLTMNELGFLMSIQPLIEYQINAIMNKETNSFMTVSEIAKYLRRDRTGVSRTISSLLEKGILFEFVNVQEIKKFNRNVSSRTLFVNPELFYSGDRNKIDGTLATLVSEYDQLENNGIKLDWKVWKKSGRSFGRLYSRKRYLEFKRNNSTP